jgi:hypothetical protein
MSRTKSVQIGTTTFHVTKFDALTQLKLLGDLQKEIVPSAGALFGAVVGEAGETRETRDEQAIMDALRQLSGRLGGDELKKWFDVLVTAENVSFELEGREPQTLTEAHRGLAFQDYSEILELMFHVLTHNFSGPLVRWAGRFGPAREKLANLSGSLIPGSNES